MKRLLNLSYGAIQGTYWMYFGAMLSFASVFLLGKGYTNSEIGVILAVANIIAVILQPLLADVADRSKRVSLIGITGTVTAGLLIGTATLNLFAGKTLTLSVLFVLLGAWLSSLQPLINSMAFHLSGSGYMINFGMARSGGSVAYALLCAVLGSLVAQFGVNVIPVSGLVLLVLMLITLAATKRLYQHAISGKPDRSGSGKSVHSGRRESVHTGSDDDSSRKKPACSDEPIGLKEFATRNRFFIIFSVSIVFVFFQNSVINTYLMQIITEVGGTSSQMGRLFSFMALLELPGLFFFTLIRKRFSCQFLLKVASAAFVLKIFFTFTAPSVAWIYAAFLFQLVSFPIFLSASVHLVDEVMEKGEAVKGQSLITGMITLSNVFASLAGGFILDYMGAAELLLVSTVLCIIGTLVVFLVVGKIQPRINS